MGFWFWLVVGGGLLAMYLDDRQADRRGIPRFGEGGGWLRALVAAYVITEVADAAVSDPTPSLEIEVD